MDIWDRFDHVFIEALISETIDLRKLDVDKDGNPTTTKDEGLSQAEIDAVKQLYNSEEVLPNGKTLAQLANFDF